MGERIVFSINGDETIILPHAINEFFIVTPHDIQKSTQNGSEA